MAEKPPKTLILSLVGTALLASCIVALAPSLPERAIASVLSPWHAPSDALGPTLADIPFPTQGPRDDYVDFGEGIPTLSSITVREIASGFSMPTDVQFVPGSDSVALVLEKNGTAKWLTLPEGNQGTLFSIEVERSNEQGLLGVAFHPQFEKNGKLYLDYVVPSGARTKTRIAEWTVSKPTDLPHATAKETKLLLEVQQPYGNHKAGQLAFGPDGMLYIGFGDGGSGNDPHGNGQKRDTLLGKMLRVDVDHPEAGKPYGIPKDNPWIGDASIEPEIWAYGLRNPWRYSFDPKGRLIIADVGQKAWEEISIVQSGDNLGWSIKEGFVCAKGAKTCDEKGLVDPVYAYPHAHGEISITGGYVYLGKRLPQLKGKYVFGDFAAGTIYALTLPDDRKQRGTAERIGKFRVAPATFGRDASGEVYVADFAGGALYRLDALPPSAATP